LKEHSIILKSHKTNWSKSLRLWSRICYPSRAPELTSVLEGFVLFILYNYKSSHY